MESFVAQNEVEYSNNLIKSDDLDEVIEALGGTIGGELTDYILKYGYLAYKFLDLYGVNSKQFLDSDMIKQTKYLHEYFPNTIGLIALENQGDGAYCLVDADDNVYKFDSETNTLVPMGKKMYDYILQRFEDIKKMN